MVPRKYQSEAISRAIESLSKHKRVAVVLPTGAGKTFVASQICKEFEPIIWSAHRRELLDQADNALNMACVNHTMLSAFANDIPKQKYNLFVIDECHHEPCSTYRKLLDNLNCDKILGITATPFRLDSLSIRFNDIIEVTSYGALVNEGYLAEPRLFTVRVDDIVSDLAYWVNCYSSKIGQTIFFVKSLADAQKASQIMKMPNEIISANSDRESQISRFKSGEIQVLISCLVLTEGVDLPSCKTVVVSRLTDSRALMNQMIGRAVRPYAGKSHCNIVEPAVMFGKPRQVTATSAIIPKEQFVSWNCGISKEVFVTERRGHDICRR